jgi:hypothetical protein
VDVGCTGGRIPTPVGVITVRIGRDANDTVHVVYSAALHASPHGRLGITMNASVSISRREWRPVPFLGYDASAGVQRHAPFDHLTE